MSLNAFSKSLPVTISLSSVSRLSLSSSSFSSPPERLPSPELSRTRSPAHQRIPWVSCHAGETSSVGRWRLPAGPARPARIVLYRRPLLARADGEDELGELVLDVVIEEFARLLGLDPQVIDPDYPEED